ncbi:MAG: Phenylacetic acid catabolic protein [Candidatus Kariarchaeaceae archaeon]
MRKFETPLELAPEYRELLLKMLFVQADTEFASVEQHRDWQTDAPTAEDRWVLSRIVTDEVRHGLTMVRLLKTFGEDGEKAIDTLMKRRMGDHTLEAFNLEFKNWAHVCAFTCFVDRVGLYQLESFVECSYAPLAKQIPMMLTEEQLHINFGYNGLKKIINSEDYPGDKEEAQEAVDYWVPRALDMFGHSDSENARLAQELGIKRWQNEEMRERYYEEITGLCEKLGLKVPPIDKDRHII